MTKVSELIGTIPDTEPPIDGFTTDKGEKFIILRAHFKEVEMDVAVSSFVYTGVTGRCKITGRFCTDKRKDENDTPYNYYYIYAQDIVAVDPEECETNEIYVNAKITKIGNFLVTKKGIEILFVYATTMDMFGKTDVLKLCLKGEDARKYRNEAPGAYVKGLGYMKSYKNSIEILIHELEE